MRSFFRAFLYNFAAKNANKMNCNSPTPQCPLHFLRPSPYGDVGNVGQVFYLRVRQANAQKIADLLLLFGEFADMVYQTLHAILTKRVLTIF